MRLTFESVDSVKQVVPLMGMSLINQLKIEKHKKVEYKTTPPT